MVSNIFMFAILHSHCPSCSNCFGVPTCMPHWLGVPSSIVSVLRGDLCNTHDKLWDQIWWNGRIAKRHGHTENSVYLTWDFHGFSMCHSFTPCARSCVSSDFRHREAKKKTRLPAEQVTRHLLPSPARKPCKQFDASMYRWKPVQWLKTQKEKKTRDTHLRRGTFKSWALRMVRLEHPVTQYVSTGNRVWTT